MKEFNKYCINHFLLESMVIGRKLWS